MSQANVRLSFVKSAPLRVAVVTLAFALPFVVPWASAPADLELYYKWAHAIFAGALPYRDVPIEYPPLAVLIFLLPHCVGAEPNTFMSAFVILMGCIDALQKWLLWRAATRRFAFLLIFCVVALPLYYTYLKRFDVAAVAPLALACLALTRDPRSLGAWLWLSAGTCVKLFPAFIAPLAICYSYKRGVSPARIALQVGVAAASALVPLGVAYALAGDASWSWLKYHHLRGLHAASSYAAVLLVSDGLGAKTPVDVVYGALQITTPAADAWAVRSSFVMLTLVCVTCAIYARQLKTPVSLWRGAAAVVCALLLASKVLSPQYMVWLVPLVAMASTEGKKIDFWLAGFMLLTTVFTAQTFPGEPRLANGDKTRQIFLLLRTVSLVALWVRLLFHGVRAQRVTLSHEHLLHTENLAAADENRRLLKKSVA